MGEAAKLFAKARKEALERQRRNAQIQQHELARQEKHKLLMQLQEKRVSGDVQDVIQW